MENMDNFSKSKSVIKSKSDEDEITPNKKFNFKGKQLSFSQASEISDDTKDNHKLFSPVSNTQNNLYLILYIYHYNYIIAIGTKQFNNSIIY